MNNVSKITFEGKSYPIENKSRKNNLKSVKNLDKRLGKNQKNHTKFYRRDN